jgi:hypothetical protein
MATRRADAWTPPATIAEGGNFVANWADVPSVMMLPDGTLAAHWLVATGRAAYDVTMAISVDAGRTWSAPVTPHRDGTPTEHGFVSIFASTAGPGAIWLDGRAMAGVHDPHAAPSTAQMSLRSAEWTGGRIGQEQLVDDRVCDCCPTSAVTTDRGALVAYRDRSSEEVRDIFVARLQDGRWQTPHRVHADGWQIPGCPVNGPALAADGRRVAIAWFTGADSTPRVNVAFSDDAGDRFAAPVRVDDGTPIGRVGAAMLPDGSAVVSWIDHNGGDGELRVRRIERRGERGPIVTVARVASDRSSGMPRLVHAAGRVILAWASTDGRPHVKLAIVTSE